MGSTLSDSCFIFGERIVLHIKYILRWTFRSSEFFIPRRSEVQQGAILSLFFIEHDFFPWPIFSCDGCTEVWKGKGLVFFANNLQFSSYVHLIVLLHLRKVFKTSHAKKHEKQKSFFEKHLTRRGWLIFSIFQSLIPKVLRNRYFADFFASHVKTF